MNEDQKILFKRLKEIRNYWVQTSVNGLNSDTDLIWSDFQDDYVHLQKIFSDIDKQVYERVINETLTGMIHSILVMFDGGDELTDQYSVDIINMNSNRSLKEGIALHEEFFDYLLHD